MKNGKPEVFVVLRGGLLEGVYSEAPLEVTRLDYDENNSEEPCLVAQFQASPLVDFPTAENTETLDQFKTNVIERFGQKEMNRLARLLNVAWSL